MAGWESVPWMVGGGAQHSPEVARMLAYVAFRGNEGVVGAGDLKVRALGVPGGSVTVDPGACAILCRSPGQLHQAYAGRVASQDTVGIAPTGAGAGRSDLVVARVEDPWLAGEPWADPADPAAGPYIFTRVIPGVPAGTTSLAQLGLGQSGIELARIDIPASTATITQPMIVDLRKVANSRRARTLLVSSPAANDSLIQPAYRDWPTAAVKPITVPSWATQMKIVSTIAGALADKDRVDGFIRNRVGTWFGQDTRFDTNAVGATSGGQADKTLMTADTVTVPIALRGTNLQQVAVQGRVDYRGVSGTGVLLAYTGTTVVTDIEFLEVAE